MSPRRTSLAAALVMAASFLAFPPAAATAQPVTSQFTYQGYLENGGVAYTGNATLTFNLFNTATGGTMRATRTIANVEVVNGVFTTVLNFGTVDSSNAPLYDGRPLYLDILVTINLITSRVTPRQAVQPTPFALSIPNVTSVGTNVGIGTVAPAARLDVIGETRTSTVEVTNGVVQKGGAIPATTDLGLYSLTAGSWLRLVSNNAPMHFFVNSAQGTSSSPAANSAAMSILPSNRVGIGTFSPGSRLHVSDTDFPSAIFQSSSNIGTWLQLPNTSGGGRNWTFISTGSGNGEGSGKLLISDQTSGGARMAFDSAGNVGIGTVTPTDRLHVNGNIRAKVIIVEGGADLAEAYDVEPFGDVKPIPGMVVSIDPERIGKLRIASRAHDHSVAGIISGADNVSPGLLLGQKGTVADGEFPIANVGRVWCYVDADAGGAVVPGDLLTTSSTPGHAMKVSDRAAANGATLGKAMSPLPKGKGLVLILVTLQ